MKKQTKIDRPTTYRYELRHSLTGYFSGENFEGQDDPDDNYPDFTELKFLDLIKLTPFTGISSIILEIEPDSVDLILTDPQRVGWIFQNPIHPDLWLWELLKVKEI